MSSELLLKKMIIGHYIEDIPADCSKPVSYVMQGDGVWEIRTNNLGKFTTKVADCRIPGLLEDMEEGWELNFPAIPMRILVQILSFFRKINDQYDSEVFIQVFWDKNTEEYFAHCPKQTVSGASVKYENDEFINDSSKVLVLEIHSHNSMSAFFSGVDDADEKGDRFYGVVGRVNQPFPEIILRLSIGGRKSNVDIGYIFDIDEDGNYPIQWLKQVSKYVPKKTEVRKYRNGHKKIVEEDRDQLPFYYRNLDENYYGSMAEDDEWMYSEEFGFAESSDEKEVDEIGTPVNWKDARF